MPYTVSVYECSKCYAELSANQFRGDGELEGYECPECGQHYTYITPLFQYERPARYVTVAAYDIYRAYGGAEEGGWWYDVGTLYPETVRAFEAGDWPQIAEYRAMIERRFQGSCQINTYIEEVAPTSYPKRRPYYC